MGTQEAKEIGKDIDGFVGDMSLFAGCTTVQRGGDTEIDLSTQTDAAKQAKLKKKKPAAPEVEEAASTEADATSVPAAGSASGGADADGPGPKAPSALKSKAPAVPDAPPPKAPMKDLLDCGQNDLLDLDAEPTALVVKKAPGTDATDPLDLLGLESAPPAGSALPGQVGSPAPANKSGLQGELLLFDPAPPADHSALHSGVNLLPLDMPSGVGHPLL